MPFSYYLGIDPGLGGAFALLDSSGRVHKASPLPLVTEPKTKKKKIDPCAFQSLLRATAPWIKHTVIELVHAMPGQGVSSTFTFGRGYGTLLAVLELMKLPYEEVTPQKWKRRILQKSTPDKRESILHADTTVNARPYLYVRRGGKPHDGVADAICLAEYALVAKKGIPLP